MKKKTLIRLVLGALLMSVLALAALANDGDPPEGTTLEIQYDGTVPLQSIIDDDKGANPDRDYTGFEITVADGVLVNWSELNVLESAGMGVSPYAIRFVNLQDIEIGADAFSSNSRLTRVEGLDSITVIADRAFAGRDLLEHIDATQVTFVGESAFEHCAELTSLSLAQGADVGAGAFSGCAGLTGVGNVGIVLKEDTAGGAFSGCAALKSVRIEGGSTLSPLTFSGCKGLKSVALGDGLALTSQLLADSTAIESLEMGRNPVVGENAMKDRKALKSLLLGEGAVIGPGAFSGCTGLPRAVLGDRAQLGASAFAGCVNIASLGGKLAELGDSALKDCEKLAAVELSAGGAPVGVGAFYGCVALSTVGGKVSHAASRAFEGSLKLQTIALVDGARVDSSAFQDCLSLETVTGRLGPVGRSAFSGCARLRSVSWPTTNTYGMDAFIGCALDFTKSVPAGLSLSNATRQTPYAVFALTGDTVKLGRNALLNVGSTYTLQTASGTPYSALRTPPFHWLDSLFLGDSDHSPRVTLSGTFDTSVPGSYPLELSIPGSWYASAHKLSFTLEVSEEEAGGGEPEEPDLDESSWFLANEFVATLGFRYTLIYGDARALTLSCSKKSVCRIGADGTLAPVALGTATVAARDGDGVLRKCAVKVVPNRFVRTKPPKGEVGQLTTGVKRLSYQGGRLMIELYIVNRTGAVAKHVRGAKLQLWNEDSGQLLCERALGTLLKAPLPHRANRVFTASINQALINGGKKLDLGRGDVSAKIVFPQP